jgi:uncharacterized membrane protein YeaQ/YmgE (transglycosylase-associated protein family)
MVGAEANLRYLSMQSRHREVGSMVSRHRCEGARLVCTLSRSLSSDWLPVGYWENHEGSRIWLADTVLGIAGAMTGGFIMRWMGYAGEGDLLYTVGVAIAGAVILTVVVRLLTGRPVRWGHLTMPCIIKEPCRHLQERFR